LPLVCALCLALFLPASAPADTKRVVSLNLCTDEYLALLAPASIAALSPLASDPSLSVVAGQAARLPRVRPDAEAVLQLHPDLVLAGEYGAQTVLAFLRHRGIRVVQVPEADDFTSVAAETYHLAAILHAETRGVALVAHMKAVLAGVVPRVRGRAILWQARGYSAGQGSFGDALLRAAGFADAGTGERIGIEALINRPPDVLVTETAPAYPSLATAMLSHPALAHLRRATIDPALLACPGPWSAAAVVALAH
jgi:iron complex transport system substrate-binding protein